MNLKSGYPFWAVKNGLIHSFPKLESDLQCDVLVLGGGITGALMARELANSGFDVAVIEQRDVAWGSTAASTAMLQYEIDTHMTELAKCYGEDDAVLAYQACAEAIPLMQDLAAEVRDVDFAKQKSLYVAGAFWHMNRLKEEFQIRKRHGFAVELLSRDDVRGRFGIDASVAILSHLAARIDPYRFASKLLNHLCRRGVKVFDRTRVDSFECTQRRIVARTDKGLTITAGHLVLALGYASQRYLKQQVAKNRSSYAFITDPIDKSSLGFLRNTLVWESARPYLYMRTTGDGRVLVGGEDDDIDIAFKRDAKVQKKAATLQKRVQKMFPELPMDPAFSWAGTFAETRDGLPFFGPHEQWGPRVQFAMAYGGNGITYSAIGAELVSNLIQRKPHRLARLFSFDRLSR